MKRIIYLLFALVFSFNLFSQPCLTGFDYRTSIAVDNSSNPNLLTDFQIKLTLNTSALVSAGKLRADGGDLRFLNFSGYDLDFWIENGTFNTNSTVIWIKCDAILASTVTNIYMFYGNLSATSTATPTATTTATIIATQSVHDQVP